MKLPFAALFALIAGIAAPVHAAPDLHALLIARDHAALDKALRALDAGFQRGETSERDYWRQLKPVAEGRATLGDELDAWVLASRQPGLARMLRGLFRHKQGWLARGADYAQFTPEDQYRRMSLAFEGARADLEQALQTLDKCNFCYATLIDISKAQGDCERAMQWYALAMQKDPRAYFAPLNMFVNLLPRWCGQPGEAEAFVARFEREQGDSPALRRLRHDLWLEQSKDLDERGARVEALALIDRILAEDPAHVRAWAQKGYLLATLGRKEQAMTVVERVLALEPDNAWAYGQRARLLLEAGRNDAALRDIERGLELGNRHAAVEGLYHFAGIGTARTPPDHAKYIALCRRILQHNLPEGYTCTGSNHYFGIGGTPVDKAEAFKWWKIGADRGVTQSMVDVGLMLWNGEGVARDEPAALHYWLMGHRRGDPRAEGHLRAHLGAWAYFEKLTLPALFKAAHEESLAGRPLAQLERFWGLFANSPAGDWLRRYGLALLLVPVLGLLLALRLSQARS